KTPTARAITTRPVIARGALARGCPGGGALVGGLALADDFLPIAHFTVSAGFGDSRSNSDGSCCLTRGLVVFAGPTLARRPERERHRSFDSHSAVDAGVSLQQSHAAAQANDF